jgi:hypothetical protein
MLMICEVWLLNKETAHSQQGKLVGVRSQWNVFDLDASGIEQDWTRLFI